MKAIVITGIGGPEVLEIRDVPTPEPRGEQVRVRVRAFGLNRADLLQCRGVYPAPPVLRPTFRDSNIWAKSINWGRMSRGR